MYNQLTQQSWTQFDKIARNPEQHKQNSAGEKGVLEIVLRKGASVSCRNNLTKNASCPKHRKQE